MHLQFPACTRRRYIMATIKSGYLKKMSGFFKRDWKRRYIVLYQDGELVYYERAGVEHSDGRLNIRRDLRRIDHGYEVEKDAQQKASGSITCLFSVRTTQKTVYLLADSEEEARDWIQKLNEIRQNATVVQSKKKKSSRNGFFGGAGGGASYGGASYDGASYGGASYDGASYGGASYGGASCDGASCGGDGC